MEQGTTRKERKVEETTYAGDARLVRTGLARREGGRSEITFRLDAMRDATSASSRSPVRSMACRTTTKVKKERKVRVRFETHVYAFFYYHSEVLTVA